jgi:hypothetical protein
VRSPMRVLSEEGVAQRRRGGSVSGLSFKITSAVCGLVSTALFLCLSFEPVIDTEHASIEQRSHDIFNDYVIRVWAWKRHDAARLASRIVAPLQVRLFSGGRLQDSDLKCLDVLARQPELDVVCCNLRPPGRNSVQISDAGLAHVASLSKLRQLRLDGSKLVTDSGLACVGKLGQTLRWLSLRGCRLICAGSPELGRLVVLELLDVGGCEHVCDQFVQHICALPNLAELDVSNSRITGASMPLIAQLPALRTLALKHCDMVFYDAREDFRARRPSVRLEEECT